MSLVYSYGALFLMSFLAASILPLASEGSLILLVRSEGVVAVPILVATMGNALGACTTYWISRRAARALAGRHKASAKRERATRFFERYGQPALLFTWIPVLGDALVALAGATRIRFWSFCFWMTLGKGLRYLAVALVALNFF